MRETDIVLLVLNLVTLVALGVACVFSFSTYRNLEKLNELLKRRLK